MFPALSAGLYLFMLGYRGMPIAVFTSIKQKCCIQNVWISFYLWWFDYSEEKGGKDQNVPSVNPARFILFQLSPNWP